MRSFRWLIPLLGFSLSANALTEEEIQGFINEAIKAGGGEVVIPPGVHTITKGLMIKDAKKLRLIGLDTERCILKRAPLPYAETAQPAPAGSTSIVCKRLHGFTAGMRIQTSSVGVHAKQIELPSIAIQSVEGSVIKLTEGIKTLLPAGTPIFGDGPLALIEIRGDSDLVGIEKLTLDGGFRAGDPAELIAPYQTALIVAKGAAAPAATPVQNLVISRCVFQNIPGVAVATGLLAGGTIEDNVFMDCTGVAIRLGPGSGKVRVVHNRAARCLTAVELVDATSCEVRANEFMDCDNGLVLREQTVSQDGAPHEWIGNTLQNMKAALKIEAKPHRVNLADNEIVSSVPSATE